MLIRIREQHLEWAALVALVTISSTSFGQQQQQPPADASPLLKRFEYKHSFRAPNLAQRDGSIPFWIVTGDAIASSEQLRLAPSMRSRKGIAWNKRPMVESENFEVEVALKITGQGRIGGDGMAIWYTAGQGTLGPVFGANDFWSGLGIFLDSFDNDGLKNNPFVAVMVNDGTRSYDHQSDGAQQIISGCQKDFRNKPYPVRVKIEYLRNVLTVFVHDGLTQQPRYELCVRAENIVLPKGGYFGISAATGGLADDHDALDFSAYAIYLDGQKPVIQTPIPQEEKQKYDAEFEKQMQEYEQERKKYKEKHPEKARSDEDEYEQAKYFEDHATRELRFIHESQSAIHRVLQQMELKLQEIAQQQATHTSIIQQQRPQGAVQQVAPGGAAPIPTDSFQQHEKNEVLQSLRDLTTAIRDMKNYVNEVFTRTYNIEQKLAGATGGQTPQDLSSIKHSLDGIQSEVQQIRSAQSIQSVQSQQSPPAIGTPVVCPTCLSSSLFFVVLVLQSFVILGFIFMRSKSDKAKFY